MVKTTDSKVTVKVIERKTAKEVELTSFNTKSKSIKLAMKDIYSIARIIWASQ